jgi:hypothetical protein
LNCPSNSRHSRSLSSITCFRLVFVWDNPYRYSISSWRLHLFR